MDRGAWQATVGSGRSPLAGGATLVWTALRGHAFLSGPHSLHQSLGWEDLLEEGMATHSSILAWRIPWTEEPGGLQFIGLQRVGHN